MAGHERRGGSLCSPPEMPSGSWQGAGIILQDETASSQGVRLQIGGPVDGADVKVKDATIFRGHLLQKVNGIFANESPFVGSEKV